MKAAPERFGLVSVGFKRAAEMGFDVVRVLQGHAKHLRLDCRVQFPQNEAVKGYSNRRNGMQMDERTKSDFLNAIRALTWEIRWLREAAERAYPLSAQDQAKRQIDLERKQKGH